MEQKPRFALPVDAPGELSLLTEKDVAELFRLIEGNRQHLRQWLPWVDYETSLEDSRSFVRRSLQRYQEGEGFELGVRYQGRLAGVIGLHTIDWPNRRGEIGYWLGAAFQGHGLITNACHALLKYAFHELQLNRMEILCATGNARSRAIPERLGFVQEGIRREGGWLYDHFVDLVVYSMLAREWNARYPA